MSTRFGAGRVRATYRSIRAHQGQFWEQLLCRALERAPSGYYARLQHQLSDRTREDARLLRLIRASFVASHRIYCAARVFLDSHEAG